MSGDSKDFKGDSDDLLSQLLDLEDVISQPAEAAPDSSKTEVLTKDAAKKNEKTEVMSQEPQEENSVALDEFLKDDTDAQSALENTNFFTDQLAKATPSQDSNFQSFEEEIEHTILDQAKPVDSNPFDEPQRDKTIILDSPLEEIASEESTPNSDEPLVSDKTEFVQAEDFAAAADFIPPTDVSELEPEPSQQDPIEAALAEFSSDQGDDLSAAAVSHVQKKSASIEESPELEVEDLFSAPEAQSKSSEMSAEDFADVFQSGPIQVPQQRSKVRAGLKNSKKWIGLAAGIFIPIGLISFAAVRLWSEDGLFGVRVEGLTLEKVYRAPSDEILAAFKLKIQEAQQARLADDPEKMESSIPELERILQQDVRNYAAANELLELSGLMIAWKGLQGAYPAKYEQALKQLKEIESKSKEPLPQNSFRVRAKVWRAMAAGELPVAHQELEQFAQKSNLLNDDNKALLGELAYRSGDNSKAKEFLNGISESHRRGRFYLALVDENKALMQALAKDKYLPAKVELEASQNRQNLQDSLPKFDQLLTEVKDYPWLASRVQANLGDLYQASGDGMKAREYWKEIVAKSPDDFRTWKKLAISYESDAEWEEALNAYRAAIKAGGLERDTSLRFARLLRLRLKVVEALDLIELAVAKYPKLPEFYYEKGQTQLSIYQEEPAKTSFKKALEVSEGYEPALLSLAQIAIKQQDLAQAQELFSKIKETSPNYSKALMGLGRLALHKRNFDEAKRFFALSIKTNPKNEEAYDHLVRLLLRDEEDQKALALAEQAVEQIPRSPSAHLTKARVLNFQGRNDLAQSEIDPFLRTHNHYLPLTFMQISIFLDTKNYAGARELLEQISAKEMSEPEILYLKARLNYEDEGSESSPLIGSKEAAWRYIQSAISTESENERFISLQAKIAMDLDERMQAFEVAERLQKLYPNNPTAYIVKGDFYNLNTNYDQALAAYQKAQSLTKFKGEIFRKIASVYKAQGQTARAIQYYQRLVQWYPSDSGAFLELGKLYNDEGRYAKAIESFRRASQLRPNLAEAYYYMGFIQKETGDHASAVRNFEKYLSLDPNGIEAATVKDEIYFLKNGSSAN